MGMTEDRAERGGFTTTKDTDDDNDDNNNDNNNGVLTVLCSSLNKMLTSFL